MRRWIPRRRNGREKRKPVKSVPRLSLSAHHVHAWQGMYVMYDDNGLLEVEEGPYWNFTLMNNKKMGKALIIMSVTFLWNLVGLWFSGRVYLLTYGNDFEPLDIYFVDINLDSITCIAP